MLAMLDAAASGRQAALMAPTEILARQHFETIGAPLAGQGVRAVLLTGRDKGGVRAGKLAEIASARAAVAVGTHALFQDEVIFKALALSVIDEQHQFEVSGTLACRTRARASTCWPCRRPPFRAALELTVFGDLDVSRLDEKPPGRAPVKTRAAPMPRLAEVVSRLASAIGGGAQAFWICPDGRRDRRNGRSGRRRGARYADL